jgi:hypothetical protein
MPPLIVARPYFPQAIPLPNERRFVLENQSRPKCRPSLILLAAIGTNFQNGLIYSDEKDRKHLRLLTFPTGSTAGIDLPVRWCAGHIPGVKHTLSNSQSPQLIGAMASARSSLGTCAYASNASPGRENVPRARLARVQTRSSREMSESVEGVAPWSSS